MPSFEAKTARGQGIKTQKFFHDCGGQIFMKALFSNGRLKPVAECEKCHITARHIKNLYKVG
jgi:hypothetical protein